MTMKTPISIFCRIKPQHFETPQERQEFTIEKNSNGDVLTIIGHQASCPINHKPDFYKFQFVKVFDQDSNQELVYNTVARPIVESALKGYNGTIFAYGQTGSGKTYTISGDVNSKGIIPRALSDIFEDINNAKDVKFEVHMSYLEIYNEHSNDLLSPINESKKKISLREGGDKVLEWHNLRLCSVSNLSDATGLLEFGDSNRIVCDTPMNVFSSRSHTILTIYLTAHVLETLEIRRAKLNLVDLAGSERVHKTGEEGIILEEARHINLSLHYLQQVIVALSETSRIHVPYRNCSLTAALRDSLGGNSMTAMIANIAVEKNNGEETISTCRFAQRVALVRNELLVNIERDVNEENVQLKEELALLRIQCENLQSKIRELELKSSSDESFKNVCRENKNELHPKKRFKEEPTDNKNSQLGVSQLKTDTIYLIDLLRDELKGKNSNHASDNQVNLSTSTNGLLIKKDLDKSFSKFAASSSAHGEWLNAEEDERQAAKALSLKRDAITAVHEDILNWWRVNEKTLVRKMLSEQTFNILNCQPDSVNTPLQDNCFDELLHTHSDLLKDFQLLKSRLRHTKRCLQRIKRKFSLEYGRWSKDENDSSESLPETESHDNSYKQKQRVCDFLMDFEKRTEVKTVDNKQKTRGSKILDLRSEYDESDFTNDSNYSIRESDLNTTFGEIDDSIFSTSTMILDRSSSSSRANPIKPRLCCSVPSIRESGLGQKPKGLHTLNERYKSPLNRTASVLLTGDVDVDQEIVAFYERKQVE